MVPLYSDSLGEPYSTHNLPTNLTYGTITLCCEAFQPTFAHSSDRAVHHIRPVLLLRVRFDTKRFSFAITSLISIDFSSTRYSDASIHGVLTHLWVLGNLGFKGRMHLPLAYRSLPRPITGTRPSPVWLITIVELLFDRL